MKVIERWSSHPRPTLSFELFPPRTEKAAATFDAVIDHLADLKPDFVSVTFGAGGSTRGGSRQLIEQLGRKGLEVMAYFAGYGLGPSEIITVLDDYQSLGIDNLLVVRGDPPHNEPDFQPHPESLTYASDMMVFVRPKYTFCMGVAGYPEGHIECESLDRDIEFLKLKIDNGAEYVITNYFYDNRFYFDFMERCRKVGIDVPILPGIMPVYSVKMMNMLARLCGATITETLSKGIAALPEGDTAALTEFGVDFAVDQCRELLEAGVPGLHIYTMDRSTSTVAIVERLRNEGLL